MKIAYYISNRTTFPPQQNTIAASTTVVLNIIKHIKNKHEIAIYAPLGSKLPGVKIETLNLTSFNIDSSLGSDDWITKAVVGMKQMFIGELFKNASSYDIIHLHTEPIYLAMPYLKLINTPVLFTMHNEYHSFEEQIFKFYDKKVYLNALSKKQASFIPFTSDIPVIYNGVNISDFEYSDNDEGYLLFLGRMTKEKGIHDFLELAQKDEIRKYYIIGKGEKEYEDLARNISNERNNIKYLDFLPRLSKEWLEILKKAKALIMPVLWNEPFGLVAIEAMACGVPVLAYNNGALPEIVMEGETGYLIDSNKRIEGLFEAVTKLFSLSHEQYLTMRQKARKRVVDNFTSEKMATEYEKLYYQITEDYKSK